MSEAATPIRSRIRRVLAEELLSHTASTGKHRPADNLDAALHQTSLQIAAHKRRSSSDPNPCVPVHSYRRTQYLLHVDVGVGCV